MLPGASKLLGDPALSGTRPDVAPASRLRVSSVRVSARLLVVACLVVAALAVRAIGLGDRARLRLHLTLCAMCSRVEHQMGFLRRAMRHIDES